jgi:hypothetical protein
MRLTREDYLYNRLIQREKDERSFPTRAKVMIGASILVGFLIALALFIGSVRATEEVFRQLNY